MVSDGSRVVVTVIGKDRVGIIAGVTSVLASCNVNILDISQTILQDVFAMIMIVDLAGAIVDLGTLQQRLEEKGQQLGVKVTALHEDVFRFMHRL
ncbi:MAG: ACT domain-containing protein [Syntrophomonadaceae bacterium]|nr:ACT domain-containing protein [Syntrophomonadaceae bacterium]